METNKYRFNIKVTKIPGTDMHTLIYEPDMLKGESFWGNNDELYTIVGYNSFDRLYYRNYGDNRVDHNVWEANKEISYNITNIINRVKEGVWSFQSLSIMKKLEGIKLYLEQNENVKY